MKFLKFPLPKELQNYKPKKIIPLNSIGEVYIGFEEIFEKPRRRSKK